ncbi:MAG: hypothetical protein CMM25_08635, partial [Rhodospirillaceae bacterium]|nr:hypothetical protein [Rhodospirillaceae bacterium]
PITYGRVLSIDVGIKNLAVCLLNGPKHIEFWTVFDIGNNTDTTRHLRSLESTLNEHPEIINPETIKTILIEKQPSFNPRMRVIGSALHMYFVMKGFRDIRQYSPKFKLQLCMGSESYDKGNRYAKNKKRAIDTMKYYLDNVEELRRWKLTFNQAKKKDDYADSFLQGMSFYKIYQKTTRTVKKPTAASLKKATSLDRSHFSWLWEQWKQEYIVAKEDNKKPSRGPMAEFVSVTSTLAEKYTMAQFLTDKLSSTPKIKERLVLLYNTIEEFVNECQEYDEEAGGGHEEQEEQESDDE